MARSSNKHGERAQIIQMNNFLGGLALDRPAELLDVTELSQADNLHFDVTTGALQTVPGLRPRHQADGEIKSMFWSTLFGRWLFVIDGKLYAGTMEANDKDYSVVSWTKSVFESTESVYNLPKNSNVLLGELSGATEPGFAEFGRKVCIASGGVLQVWDGVELKSVEAKKPESEEDLIFDLIFVWGKRLLGAKSGDDVLYFSSVGDPEDWNFSSVAGDTPSSSEEDLSLAQWAQIGYLDSARIVAMGMIAQDLVVCKRTSDGSPIVYRLTGRFEDNSLAVQEINRTSDVYNSRCLVQANNDLFYFGSDGFQGFSTVQQYGDIKMADIGRRMNILLARQGNSAAKMWHIRPFGQVWIQPSRARDIYIYHYALGAFTLRKFFQAPSAICVVEDDVYVAIGNRVLQVDDTYKKDSWGYALNPVGKSKKFRGRSAYVVKGVTAKTSGEDNLDAEVRIGRVILPLRAERKGKLIYGNTDLVFNNQEQIYQGSRKSGITRKKANVRMEEWQMELIVREGKMTLDAVEIDVVEVN